MAFDPETNRQRAAAGHGKQFWRGLEELAETPEFQEYLRREFPEQAETWTDPVTRRQFLLLMGASLALAGVSGCSTRPAPAEKIMPYVRQPEALTPGKPLFFATATTLAGLATGVLVESHEGRPTKVEGNPSHPASLGGTDLYAQAAVLTLYDPDRSQSVTYRGRSRPYGEALAGIRTALNAVRNHPDARRRRGAGIRILTETVTSPTLAGALEQFIRDGFPEAKWYQYEPVGRDHVHEGARQAFGRPLNTYYDFSRADVILALDADFLACGPGGPNRYAHDFAARRRVRTKSQPARETMNRLYVVEPVLTNTGAKADHRLALRAGQVEDFARALAAALNVPGAPAAGEKLGDFEQKWVRAVAQDLKRHAGASLVLAGDGQPASLHALVHAINAALGNAGETVLYTQPVEVRPAADKDRPADQLGRLKELVRDMGRNEVDILFILGGNPVYTAPADLELGKRLLDLRPAATRGPLPLRVHLGLYQDETAVLCDWHIPEAHSLEAWGDARAYDGTATIIQPLIEPLYAGRSAIEFLSELTEQSERTGYELVRRYWRGQHGKQQGGGNFETFWQKALQDGVVPGTKFKPEKAALRDNWAQPPEGAPAPGPVRAPAEGEFEIVFRPDPTIFDGRFANNGWLQELPGPITRLTWDNAALMSPRTAARLGIPYGRRTDLGPHGGEHGQIIVDTVELTYRGRKVVAPAWVVPGHPDGTITVHLGYGRTRAGRVGGVPGQPVGFNAYLLRTSERPLFDTGLTVRRTGGRHELACVQMHHGMEGRAPVRAATLDHFLKDRTFAKHLPAAEAEAHEVRELLPGPPEQTRHEEPNPDKRLHPLTLYPEYDYSPPKHRWAMAIDLTACVGCSACVVACQAENNIPVVGKSEVLRGREMHWLRIDRYYEGDPGDAHGIRTFFQPVPCMHCEKAPCELVCPVQATVHSSDGLNDMIYNRCVGTRYCSNNCPYKVRRFNFLQYADFDTPSLKLLHNPEVTVRSRGVMEKCTYCVQRIRTAEIQEEKLLVGELAAIEERRIRGRVSAAEARAQEMKLRRDKGIRQGDVMTACQAACPAGAITFGDMNDERTDVYQWKAEDLNYSLLAELNTQPRTTYLAALRNPNLDMPSPGPEAK